MPAIDFSSRSSSLYEAISLDDDEMLMHDAKIESQTNNVTLTMIETTSDIACFEIGDDDLLEEGRNNNSHHYMNDIEQQQGMTQQQQQKQKQADQDGLTSTTSNSSSNSSRLHHHNHRPPSNYICPLTLHIMEFPVNDGCGHCFDRDAIVAWLEYHELCPISRKPLHFSDLIPATALQQRIQQWKEHNSNITGLLYDDNEDSGSDTYSQLELMLLPQERKVLSLIKVRARDRRKQQAYNRCLWSVAGATAVFLFLATCFAIKFLDVRLRGIL